MSFSWLVGMAPLSLISMRLSFQFSFLYCLVVELEVEECGHIRYCDGGSMIRSSAGNPSLMMADMNTRAFVARLAA